MKERFLLVCCVVIPLLGCSCGEPSAVEQMSWVTVRSGNFVFGSPFEGTPCRSANREEEVNVTLTHDFLMVKTEVTQYQWKKIGLALPPQEKNGDNLPVVFINFFEAMYFCNKLSELDGLDSCYDLSSCSGEFAAGCPEAPDYPEKYMQCHCTETAENTCEEGSFIYRCVTENLHKYDDWYKCPGYRLPTTAEWEFAAKAGTTTHTYNGDLLANLELICQEQPNLNDIAWYCDNSDESLHNVSTKQSNAFGFDDILGNAQEWVDYYTDGYSLDIMVGQAGEDLIDPLGPETGDRIDIRGGSYRDKGCETRAAIQFPEDPSYRRRDTGFRPVRTVFSE